MASYAAWGSVPVDTSLFHGSAGGVTDGESARIWEALHRPWYRRRRRRIEMMDWLLRGRLPGHRQNDAGRRAGSSQSQRGGCRTGCAWSPGTSSGRGAGRRGTISRRGGRCGPAAFPGARARRALPGETGRLDFAQEADAIPGGAGAKLYDGIWRSLNATSGAHRGRDEGQPHRSEVVALRRQLARTPPTTDWVRILGSPRRDGQAHHRTGAQREPRRVGRDLQVLGDDRVAGSDAEVEESAQAGLFEH